MKNATGKGKRHDDPFLIETQEFEEDGIQHTTLQPSHKDVRSSGRNSCRFVSWLPTHAAASQRNNNGSQTNKAARSRIFIAFPCEESK